MVFCFKPVFKDGFIARLFPTWLCWEMYHSLNISAVVNNLKALLFMGNIILRKDNPALAPTIVNFTHTDYHKSTEAAALGVE